MFHRATRKPVRGDYDRLWLSDDYFDLIVWYASDETIHGFQPCYGKPARERAFTWKSDGVFSHRRVDDGEPEVGKSKPQFYCLTARFPASLWPTSSADGASICQADCGISS